jgi:hypothetical protein
MADNEIRTSPKPGSPLERFAPLLGKWMMSGRTNDSDIDNITGWNIFEWLPGGYFLQSRGEMTFMGEKAHSVELIAYDAESKTFPSKVYSSMDGNALPYGWEVQGNIVTHWEASLKSKYTGILSDDGKTLTGGWKASEGEKEETWNTYNVVMTKVE